MNEQEQEQDLTQLDDPEFLAERRRLHDAISDTDGVDADLREQYAAIEREFLRRAGMAWSL
jgi:hypothetical protein